MTVYYEEIMELLTAGNFFDGISYFGQWMSKGLLSKEEIGNLSNNVSKFWESLELACEENSKVMLNLYEMLKKTRNWNDETLCKKLRISERTIGDIKSHRRPRSKAVGLKMLYELFPHMAV